MSIQIALIGAGGIGEAHSNAYKQIPDANVNAVVDIRSEFAEKLAHVHGAKIYTSVHDMLAAEQPDMVYMCTPSFTHPDITIQCLLHGLHVLVEKPIAYTMSQASETIDTAKNNHKMLMVAQVIRFWPEYIYLKQIYDSGEYGKLLQAWFSRISAAPTWSWENWYVDPKRSGMSPFELHIHDVGYLYYLLGQPDRVRSVTFERPDIYASYIKSQYYFDSDPERIIEAEAGWWQGSTPFSATFRAVFGSAVLVYDHDKLRIYEDDASDEKIIDLTGQVETAGATNLNDLSGIYNEIAYFIDCVKSGIPPEIITPEQSLITLKLLLTELESARTGSTIKLITDQHSTQYQGDEL